MLFYKELLAKNGLIAATTPPVLIFNLLIKTCLVDSYYPCMLSTLLSHNAILIKADFFNVNKNLAREFLLNPLLCQHLSATNY